MFQVTNSLMMWVMISGLLGKWIFPALLITFATDYSLVRAFIQESLKETGSIQEQNFFPLKSAVFALW